MASTLTREAAVAALDAAIARLSLAAYARLVSAGTYEQPPHVLALIEHLEALERRDISRLIVTLPPRSSKSTHVSRLFPSWWLGRNPTDGVIVASYGELLASNHGRAVRDLLSHPRYPFAAKLRTDMRAAGMWQTDAGGGLQAAGVGTGLTGFGGTLLVADDLLKGREEADSQIVRDHTWNWHEEVFMTRLQKGGVVLETMTRWHEDDPIGRILNSKNAAEWTLLNLPYEAEAGDALGRAPGERLPLFGEVPPGLSAYAFAALYQQRPAPAGGGVFKREWMARRYCTCGAPERCGLKPAPEHSERWRVIASADLGGKQGVGHDPSAIAVWGWDGISKYVLDYWSGQDEYADVKARAVAMTFEHRPRMLYVEDATWAQPLISDLRRAGVRVTGVPAIGSKWTRADSVAPEFEGGAVVLPESAPWLDGWVHEHLAFPAGRHDEAVDTTSLALSVLKRVPVQQDARVTLDLGYGDRSGGRR